MEPRQQFTTYRYEFLWRTIFVYHNILYFILLLKFLWESEKSCAVFYYATITSCKVECTIVFCRLVPPIHVKMLFLNSKRTTRVLIHWHFLVPNKYSILTKSRLHILLNVIRYCNNSLSNASTSYIEITLKLIYHQNSDLLDLNVIYMKMIC